MAVLSLWCKKFDYGVDGGMFKKIFGVDFKESLR